MDNKELIKKLNRLNSIKSNKTWKENNRAVLFNQINSSDIPDNVSLKDRVTDNLATSFKFFKSHILTPAWAGAIVLLFVISSGVVVQASGDAKPGSLFYYARLVKERTQLATTFDKKEKTKLNIKFASEHAKDITDVLNSPDFKEEDSQKLAKNFEDNLNSVKMSLEEIKRNEAERKEKEEKEKEEKLESEEEGNKDDNEEVIASSNDDQEINEDKGDNNDSSEKDNPSQDDEENTEEDSQEEEAFFAVDSGRGDSGLSVYDPSKDNDTDREESSETEIESDQVTASDTLEASTSIKVLDEIEEADSINQEVSSDNLGSLINEAELLFDQEKYEEARQKIEEFMSIIESGENSDVEGEVKGAATTAPEDLIETENSTSSEE